MFAFLSIRGTQLINDFTGVVVGDGAVGKVRRCEQMHSSPTIFIDILSLLDVSSHILYDQCIPCKSFPVRSTSR